MLERSDVFWSSLVVRIQLVKVRPVFYCISVEAMQRIVLVVHTHISSMHSCVVVISLKNVIRRYELRMEDKTWTKDLTRHPVKHFLVMLFTKLLNDHSSCLMWHAYTQLMQPRVYLKNVTIAAWIQEVLLDTACTVIITSIQCTYFFGSMSSV